MQAVHARLLLPCCVEHANLTKQFTTAELAAIRNATAAALLAALLAAQLGVASLPIPVPLPGAINPLQLVPQVSAEERRQVESVYKIVSYLATDNGDAAGRPLSTSQLAELVPFFPRVAQEVLPELTSRLGNRIAARAIREVFLVDAV